MQKQKSLKFFVLICAILILDLPKICTAKRHNGKQGSATTRGPAPTQAPQPPPQSPNSDPAKLSYGNQGPPAPAPGWNTNNQNHGPPPPSYEQSHGPPQYSQHPPSYQGQPGYNQPGAPQPVIINHVQQPQSGGSGGLGVGSGLAIGA